MQAKLQYTLKYQVFKSIFINSNPKGKLLCKCFYLYISKHKTTAVYEIFKFSFVHFDDKKTMIKFYYARILFSFLSKKTVQIYLYFPIEMSGIYMYNETMNIF